MSRFVFLPVDSECAQLVKQRDTDCGSEWGRKNGGGWRRGGNLFHCETLWLSWWVGGQGEVKEKMGRVQHNEHNDKQRNF